MAKIEQSSNSPNSKKNLAKKKEYEVTKEMIDEEKKRLKQSVPSEMRIMEEKAIQKARELEQKHVPTAKEEAEEMEEFGKESEKARKLLKPLEIIEKKKKIRK